MGVCATLRACAAIRRRAPNRLHDFTGLKERIRDRVDLVDLISEHTSLKRQGRSFVGLCPFHKEKTPSFSVNPDRQFFKCFGCNVGGDAFTFVQLRESVEFPEALRILADRAGVELDASGRSQPDQSNRADIARANAWALEFFRKQLVDKELGKKTREYLAARGVSREMVDAFGLGLATGNGNPLLAAARPKSLDPRLLRDAGLCRTGERGDLYDTFRDRLMFPILDTMNRCVGFGGRTLVDAPAKYLNTPETALFDKSKCLYGIDLARVAIEEAGCAIVVEGYTDCIAAHQHGFRNTVATLGTAATDQHMMQLRRYCPEVVLIFDSDAAGSAAADRALAVALRQNLSVRLTKVPGEKDPADYLQHFGAQGFRGLLNSATDALVFRWNHTRARFGGADSPSDRRDAVLEFVSLVSDLCEFGVLDAIQQGIIIDQLSNLLAVPAGQISRLIERRRGRKRTVHPQGKERHGVSTRPPDAEQAALLAMLEVLVNEPGLFSGVDHLLVPERFVDPVHGRIAGHVRELALTVGEFSLAELLCRVEDPKEAEVLTDLAVRGSQAGNFESTLEGVTACLARIASERDTKLLTDEVKRGESGGGRLDAAGIGDRLSQISVRLSGESHFLHRRAVEESSGSGVSKHPA